MKHSSKHCTGFDAVKEMLLKIPVDEYIAADVPKEDVPKWPEVLLRQSLPVCVLIWGFSTPITPH